MRLFGLEIFSRHEISQSFPHLFTFIQSKTNRTKNRFLNKMHEVESLAVFKQKKNKDSKNRQCNNINNTRNGTFQKAKVFQFTALGPNLKHNLFGYFPSPGRSAIEPEVLHHLPNGIKFL